MGFTRAFNRMPPPEVIAEIGGPVIVEQEPAPRVVGSATGVVAVIGETLKGDPNVPVLCGEGDFLATFGGFNKYIGDGASNGYDGNLFVATDGMQFAKLVVVSVNDRVGVVTVTRAAPGAATLTSSNLGPYALADGDTFAVTIEGPAVDGTATIQAEAASVEGSNAENYDLTAVDDRTLTVSVNGGPTQSYTIAPGDVVDIGAVTAEEIRDWANPLYAGLSVAATTGNTKTTWATDRKGLSASLQFGGAMRAKLGLPSTLVQSSQLAANNNVQNVDAVTVDELVDLLDAQLSDVTPSNAGGYLRLTRDVEGLSATLTISGTIPGIDPAGKVMFTTTLGPVTGGSETAPRATLAAGTRVSDGGGNVFLLAADTDYDEDELSISGIPIKQASGTTVLAGAINTFVDTPDATDFVSPTVTNPAGTTARPASESAWLTVYQAALYALKANASPAKEVTDVVAARHQVAGSAIDAIMDAVSDHCVAARARGQLRIANVSPAIGQSLATVTGTTGVGAGSTTAGGRTKHAGYMWPGIQKRVSAITTDDPTLDGIIDWPSDIFAASKASLLAPELSIEQADEGEAAAILGLESAWQAGGTYGAPTLDTYKAGLAAGICMPILDDVLGTTFESQVMRVLATDPTNRWRSERRMRDWFGASLAAFGQRVKGKLATPSLLRTATANLNLWIQGLVAAERIAGGGGRVTTPAALRGTGIVVWRVAIETLGHVRNPVFDMSVGQTVDVKEVS